MRLFAALLLSALLALPAFVFAQDKQSEDDSQLPNSTAAKVQVEPVKTSRVRLGTITVGAFYSHWSGPWYNRYPYYRYGYPYYDPFWTTWSPFFHPGYFYGFQQSDDKGEVRLAVQPKNAEVYLDGAYAGTADRLKSFWLDPGAYNLSLAGPGGEKFERRIYVLSGKTLKISAPLAPVQEHRP